MTTCTCRWYSVSIPGEPHIPAMPEAEPDPHCPEHFPPRWKLACINWTSPDGVPRAVTYVLVAGSAELTRYHESWDAAVQYFSDHASILEPLGFAAQRRARDLEESCAS